MINLAPAFLLIAVVVIGAKILKHPSVKGMMGEAVVNWAGLGRLDQSRYKVLKNVFIPNLSGEGMTEIDHVVVSAHGIFVIETKNYGGWIFGGEQDQTWTQSIFGKKSKFLNPLKQNKGHINALVAFLDLPVSMFHSVIFFIGEAELKTPMPPNVLTKGLLGYIESEQRILLNRIQLNQAWLRLSGHDASINKSTVRREHVARLSGRSH